MCCCLWKEKGNNGVGGKEAELSIRLEKVELNLLSCKLTNVFKRERGKNILNVQINKL